MKYMKMKATVKGTTCDGEAFTDNVKFTLIPPNEEEMYYGTGCYMRVETESNIDTYVSRNVQFYDVRYERTTDVEIIADRIIESWYGKNAEEITKQFDQQCIKLT